MTSESLIFSYGSNLDPARMCRRIASARVIGTSLLPGHDLRFHVRGIRDGTAKPDAFRTGDPQQGVLGVIYAIDPGELTRLDEIEGGYTRRLHALKVRPIRGDRAAKATPGSEPSVEFEAWSYHGRPDALAADLLPFDWYLQHVVRGALHHDFPGHYLDRLRRIRTLASRDDDPGLRASVGSMRSIDP
jgi:gamma-glutamylcyclotransferase